jgi:pimeloyl-ACP methyl ester carboxylesterase
MAQAASTPDVQHAESADGTPIAYRATGRGEPVLFVHGAGTWSADWLLVAPLLRDRFTVVTMDRRGREGSGDGPEYSMQREAEDILAVLDAVDSGLLVAHSFGALCAVIAAAGTDRLRRLVLYEPPMDVEEEGLAGLEDLVARGELEQGLEAFLARAGAPPRQLAAIRASRAWPGLVATMPRLPRELRAATTWRPPQGPIDVPTLLVLGGDTTSPVYLDGVDALQAAFPNLRRELIPGQRHIGHVFAAQLFADLVAEFLAA